MTKPADLMVALKVAQFDKIPPDSMGVVANLKGRMAFLNLRSLHEKVIVVYHTYHP